MPLPGRKPTDQPARRRNKPAHEWTEIPDVPFEGGPELPREIAWPTATLRWWEAVSHMPHCILWSESDWAFALDTAVVSAAFHEGDIQGATELRQREKVLGVTLDSRRDLRFRYVPAEQEEERPGVTAIAEYKKRIGANGSS